MRLITSYKKSKKSTKTKKPRVSKKELKKYALDEHHKDITPSKLTNTIIPFSKIRYGIILSCKVDSIVLDEGTINIEDSWEEVIIKLLYMTIKNNQDNFMELIVENGVTNTTFLVDNKFGRYSFDDDYKAYKIYDTDYYLEAIFNYENIYNSIANLLKINQIPYNSISFHIINTDPNIKTEQETKIENAITINIRDVYDYLVDGYHIEAIELDEQVITVHRIDAILMIFCNYIYDNIGLNIFERLESVGNTGISKGKVDDIPCSQIKNTEYYVYSDLQADDVIEFILLNLDVIELNASQFNFKFKDKNTKGTHEWEVD